MTKDKKNANNKRNIGNLTPKHIPERRGKQGESEDVKIETVQRCNIQNNSKRPSRIEQFDTSYNLHERKYIRENNKIIDVKSIYTINIYTFTQSTWKMM